MKTLSSKNSKQKFKSSQYCQDRGGQQWFVVHCVGRYEIRLAMYKASGLYCSGNLFLEST